jgi:hypothetical protein
MFVVLYRCVSIEAAPKLKHDTAQWQCDEIPTMALKAERCGPEGVDD